MRSHDDLRRLLEAMAATIRRHGAYLVPLGEFDFSSVDMTWVAGTASAEGPDAWHPDDVLIVPLNASDGRPLALLSLDDPVDGRRPADAALEVLSAVAAIAASVIEHAQLTAAAARHRAAVEHLLRVSSELTTSRSRGEMLRAVCEGIRDALGFELAGVFLDEEGDGRLLPVAGIGFDFVVERLGGFTAAALERMIAPELVSEGCVLLDSETARALAAEAGMPTGYESRNNGRGPLAWDHHWLMVPLRDRSGALLGFVWADDPADRLLPGVDGLRALRAFANHAVGAIEAVRQVERLRELAELDPLTGLRNRRGFEQGLDGQRAPLALLICDLDPCSPGHPARIEHGGYATRSAIRRATTCCGASPTCCAPARARTTWRSGSGARSSRSCCPASANARRWRWPSGCAARCPPSSASSRCRSRCRSASPTDARVTTPSRSCEPPTAPCSRPSASVATAAWSTTPTRSRCSPRWPTTAPASSSPRRCCWPRRSTCATSPPPGTPRPSAATPSGPQTSCGCLRDVAAWVLAHHERVDGAGYPRGLEGTAIPLGGRILAVADAYEAMTADRPYRRALGVAEARAELLRGAGSQFDVEVVEAFLRVLDSPA